MPPARAPVVPIPPVASPTARRPQRLDTKEPEMPHVVIEEAPDLAAASLAVVPSASRDEAGILKVVEVYLARSGKVALVDCVAVEAGRSQGFFVQLSQKERQITVRLLPATDPEKTPGVRRLMALIARQLQAASAGSRFGKTNLQDFLT